MTNLQQIVYGIMYTLQYKQNTCQVTVECALELPVLDILRGLGYRIDYDEPRKRYDISNPA